MAIHQAGGTVVYIGVGIVSYCGGCCYAGVYVEDCGVVAVRGCVAVVYTCYIADIFHGATGVCGVVGEYVIVVTLVVYAGAGIAAVYITVASPGCCCIVIVAAVIIVGLTVFVVAEVVAVVVIFGDYCTFVVVLRCRCCYSCC